MQQEILLDLESAEKLAIRACLAAGANEPTARSLVDATLSAALYGSPSVGFPHFVDYLHSFSQGRINGDPNPALERPFPAFFLSDADQGIAQLGFDLALGDFVEAANNFGVAVFSQKNSYTTGELGYYVRRLAGHGLISIAATNANAMLAPTSGGAAVYSTNPLAFGFPLADPMSPMVIDQSSSATAYVNIVAAAAERRPIPEGWAVDHEGRATLDASEALKGALLPFGGRKGANVALMVEMLAAGISGGSWSLDAGNFMSGTRSPAVGLTLIAMVPGGNPDQRIDRASAQVERLQGLGVHVPGTNRQSRSRERVKIPLEVFKAITKIAGEA
ncbi:Ldh family oxidoreductase [Ensifer sp. SSB1]|jgi:LDH2 family malate/lactate/ureidoglycolate dehydrogenase|uniref:Ldh family oxidoreductase n=1 Tax=Ensifer sp. SSB1 TaxID=2795385 RepID=UPI001A50CDB1|nr:Ldh family oxidoreductase [Ensifer sp. SSB1]MBK5571165.1 Ldh family oxidoreductase [Ensifer sp. SSB1]